jgi:hypothetical protein
LKVEVKQETSMEEAASRSGFLLGLFFNPEDGGDMFLQNISWLSMVYVVLYIRR